MAGGSLYVLLVVIQAAAISKGAASTSGHQTFSRTAHLRIASHKDRKKPEAHTAMQLWLPEWWSSDLQHWQDFDEDTKKLNDSATFHGQSGEDVYAVECFFWNQKHGTYLEMGGYNGRDLSNTWYLSLAQGWRGMLIEASPLLFPDMIANRKDDICINVAACGEHQDVHFVDAPWAATGGIWEFMKDDFKKQWHSQVELKTLPVIPCMPLSSIFAKFKTPVLDFWSLDVEGAELQVLKTFDFNEVRVNVIVLEADGHEDAQDTEVITFLKRKGFLYHGHVSRNNWFVHPEFVKEASRNPSPKCWCGPLDDDQQP